MSRKTFGTIQTVEDLNIVNDAQKAAFDLMAHAQGPDYVAQRVAAYTSRLKEALVYIAPGGRMLDIGTGWPIAPIWDLIVRDHRVNYYPLDVDPAIVANCQEKLRELGLPPENAKQAPNTTLPYPDALFDFVFSSHCLEHSSDLCATFAEIKRVLRPGGTLFFAVPFGFDDSDEHLLYLDREDWITATELAGFDVVNTHTGRTYAITSWDLAIVATRTDGQFDAARLSALALSRSKAGKVRAPHDDRVFDYPRSAVSTAGGHVIINGLGTSFRGAGEDSFHALLFYQHSYSAIVWISDGRNEKVVDLYSRVPYTRAVAVHDLKAPLTVRVIGKNDQANGYQVVVAGALLAGQPEPHSDVRSPHKLAKSLFGKLLRSSTRSLN